MTVKSIHRVTWSVTAVLLLAGVSLLVGRQIGVTDDATTSWLAGALILVAISAGVWRSVALRRASSSA